MTLASLLWRPPQKSTISWRKDFLRKKPMRRLKRRELRFKRSRVASKLKFSALKNARGFWFTLRTSSLKSRGISASTYPYKFSSSKLLIQTCGFSWAWRTREICRCTSIECQRQLCVVPKTQFKMSSDYADCLSTILQHEFNSQSFIKFKLDLKQIISKVCPFIICSFMLSP